MHDSLQMPRKKICDNNSQTKKQLDNIVFLCSWAIKFFFLTQINSHLSSYLAKSADFCWSEQKSYKKINKISKKETIQKNVNTGRRYQADGQSAAG